MSHLTLAELISSPTLNIAPETTLGEVATLMASARASAALVLRDGQPVGLFTERDLVRAFTRVVDPAQRIDGLMSAPVMGAAANLSLREGYHLLVSRGHRHLLVLRPDGSALGLLDETDFRSHLGMEYLVKARTVKSLMTVNVLTLGPDHCVAEAAALMDRYRISCVVVAKDERPLGIVTERDMVRLYDGGAVARALRLDQVMSYPLALLHAHAPLHEAVETMRARQLRRLVVVDDAGRLSGLLTEHDLLKRLEGEYVDVLKGVILEQAREIELARQALDDKATLDLVLNSVPELAVVATSPENRVVYANAAAVELFAERVLPGEDFAAAFALAGFAPELFRDVQACLGQAQGWQAAASLPGPRHFELHAACLRDHAGQRQGMVLTCRDVTARIDMETSLRQTETSLRLLLESAEDGICGLDGQGSCTFANQAAARLLGLPDPQAMVGQSLHLLAHHSHSDGTAYPADTCPVCRSYRGGETVRVNHEIFWRADGSHFPVAYRAYPLLREGQLDGAVLFFNDRSQHEQYLVELARQNDALRRWQAVTLGREGRVLEMKLEVNALLAELGRAPRYGQAPR